MGTEIDSTSSNEDNEKAAVDNEKAIEENVNDTAEKKVTEELVKVAAIKAVEQAVKQDVAVEA